MTKYLLSFTLLILSNTALSDESPIIFPELELINCDNTYHSDEEILQCEKINFKKSEEALTQFYPKLYSFFPKDYQNTLDQSQLYWKNLMHSECQLIAGATDVYIQETQIFNCLNQRYKQRLNDLIYAYLLWEKEFE